jgi:outer membrane protein
MQLKPQVVLCGLLLAQGLHAEPADTTDWKLVGDVGIGVNAAPTPARAQSRQTTAVPYLNFDAGPAFARIDMFGVKLLPVGAGHIELLTRVLSDGYTPRMTDGQRRHDSLPIGLGTLQVTPVGAFMVNAYRDVGKSGGHLVDLGPVALYPQAGLEYRSSAYVRYYNGTAAYQPGAADSPFAALFAECHLGGHWYLNGNLRRTWLATSVAASPLVRRGKLDSGLLAVSYRFN